MKKNYNISIEDNGASFIVIINNDTSERFVIGAFYTLGEAWKHIEWMYQIESQEFTVGKKETPVKEWINGMKQAGHIEMSKTIHNCDTCEVPRICGKHEFGKCTKCSFYVEVIHNNVKFGKACLCTFCRSRKGKPEWRQDKTL